MGCEGPGASGDRGDTRLDCQPPHFVLPHGGMQSGCHWSQGTDEEMEARAVQTPPQHQGQWRWAGSSFRAPPSDPNNNRPFSTR